MDSIEWEEKSTNKTDTELIQMIELMVNDIKIVTITIFHLFKKLKGRLNMLSKKLEDIFLIAPNWTSCDRTTVFIMKNTLNKINSRFEI